MPGGPTAGEMVQVSSASPHTAWALGYLNGGTTLILRWSVNAWRQPVPGNLRNQNIYSIAGGTDGTAWLWGYSGSLGYLLEHRSGTARGRGVPESLWGTVAYMNPAGSDNLWMNDYTTSGNGSVVHYDAGTWSSIPGRVGGVSFISDVLATSTQNVWITGSFCTAASGPGCTGQPAADSALERVGLGHRCAPGGNRIDHDHQP